VGWHKCCECGLLSPQVVVPGDSCWVCSPPAVCEICGELLDGLDLLELGFECPGCALAESVALEVERSLRAAEKRASRRRATAREVVVGMAVVLVLVALIVIELAFPSEQNSPRGYPPDGYGRSGGVSCLNNPAADGC
jgi:hypothetical protein